MIKRNKTEVKEHVVRTYECTVCGMKYSTYDKARKCSNEHALIVKIEPKAFAPALTETKYPKLLEVTFENGLVYTYECSLIGSSTRY